MKKRLQKKQYRKYTSWVMEDVSNPPLGLEHPSYRGVLRELPEFTPVVLDTADPTLFSADTRLVCQRYGLFFYAYRMWEATGCLIVVVSAEYPQIYAESFNNLTVDTPLERYRLLSDCKDYSDWGK